MTFATILREAGFYSKEFQNCAEIPIKLYDGKNRISTEEDVHYHKRLFNDNYHSFIEFFYTLKELEQNPVESMNIKIDEFSVILFYKTPKARFFSRKAKMDPLDYMS